MPSKANITMNKNNNNKREAIDCIEFNREATRLDNERQYLQNKTHLINNPGFLHFEETHLVTLNTRNNRTQRNTETPKGGMISVFVKIISPILPITTKQSNRLNKDTK